jgi:hypothetical protein
MRKRSVAGLGCVFLLVVLARTATSGEFDRLEGEQLAALARGPASKTHTSLTIGEIEALPAALSDTRATFLVVKTDQGNLARLLVTPAFRKPPKGEGAPLPVLVLERFDTFEPGRAASRVARGAGMLLFDGFHVDLDAGVVVPEGQGGDLVFRSSGKAGPRLEVVAGSTLFSLTRPVKLEDSNPGPSAGKAVLPGDVSGRYRLHTDGRWSGLLELRVDEARVISGQFRSEPNGTSYPIRGQVAAEPPYRATFTVKFPRTEQEFDAYLFTNGKWAIAGTFSMLDRTFGFFAVREGAKVEMP